MTNCALERVSLLWGHDATTRVASRFISPIIFRLMAKMPTLAALAHRHAMGLPSPTRTTTSATAGSSCRGCSASPSATTTCTRCSKRRWEALFILHANHEPNCSTNAMRSVGSSEVDPYSATAVAIAALYGPLRGGADEQVL